MDALDLLFVAIYGVFGLCAIGIIYNVHKYSAAQEAEREKARAKAAREEEKARKAAEKEAIAEEKAAQDAEQAAQPKRPRGRPRKTPQAMTEPEPAHGPEPAPEAERRPIIPEAPAWIAPHGNNAFAGQVVAFTGTLPDMTREEAIAAVQKNGGSAFDTMPAGTTLLVVGDKPGAGKLEKADRWAVKKIDALEFWAMLHTPLTMTPDEFAAFIMARLNTHNAKEA